MRTSILSGTTGVPNCFILGLSYADIATKIGQSEQHVIDGKLCRWHAAISPDTFSRLVCTGKVVPTTQEFNALATALDIKDAVSSIFRLPLKCTYSQSIPQPPHDAAHHTK